MRPSVVQGQGSPLITDKDRAVLLDMLDGDDLVDLFREIVTEDFGPDAACEMFGEDDLAGSFGDVVAEDSDLGIL